MSKVKIPRKSLIGIALESPLEPENNQKTSKVKKPRKSLIGIAVESSLVPENKQKWQDLEEIHENIANLILSTMISVKQMIDDLTPHLKDIEEINKLNISIRGVQSDIEIFGEALKELKNLYSGKEGRISEDDLFNSIRVYEGYVNLSDKVSALLIPTLSEITQFHRRYVPVVVEKTEVKQ